MLILMVADCCSPLMVNVELVVEDSTLFGKLGVTPMSGTFQADYTLMIDSELQTQSLRNAVWKDDRIVTMLGIRSRSGLDQ